jgi:branched-chain amino acid transport system substrate-binding protein
MKKLVALSLALMLTLALSVTAAAETIKIGGIAPLTGPVSVYGILVHEGADLYIEEVNAAGGVLGKQVEIVWMDDTHDAVEASNAYNQLASEGVSAILGPVTTTPSLAVGPLTAKDNIVMLSPSATAYDVTSAGDNVFRTCFLDPYQAELLAVFSKDVLEAGKAAVLYDNTNDYSIGLYESFVAKAGELGIEIVAVEAPVENDADYSPQLIKIADAEPDAVFICYYYETAALVLRQAVDVGLNSYMLGADGWTDIQKQVEDAPELLDKAFYCDSFSTSDDSAVAQAFVKAFEEKYGKTAAGFNALGYDTAKILLAAIEAAGDAADRDAIKAAMKATSLDCATGHITFNDHNDPIKSAFIQGFENGVPYLKSRIDP